MIAVETLGPAPELAALQLLDDQPELLDLGPGLRDLAAISRHLGGHRPHHLLECIDTGRQCGEINVHVTDNTPGSSSAPSRTSS